MLNTKATPYPKKHVRKPGKPRKSKTQQGFDAVIRGIRRRDIYG